MPNRMLLKAKPIDAILYSFIVAYSLFFCIGTVLRTSLIVSKSFFVITSFFVNGLFFFWRCVHIKEHVTVIRNIYIFSLIFFFFAPLSQYCSGVVLWKSNGLNLTYTNSDYIYANFVILCFCLFLELGYRKKRIPWIVKENKYQIRSKWSIRILLILSILVILAMVATDGLSILNSTSSILAQMRNAIMFVPAECLLITLTARKNKKIKGVKIYIATLSTLCIFLYIRYADTMGRFLSLGILMAILSFFFINNKNKSIYFFVYWVGFLFAFTALRRASLTEVVLNFSPEFNHVDFDAYQMLLMVIHYVRDNGICWGLNLVSALLCFIPRSIAPWRLEATGGIVIETFGSWFKNVSCPLPAELYYAFGVFGVIGIAYLIGIVIRKTDALLDNHSEFAKVLFCIISGMTIYIMRGAFLPAFSYTFGILLAFWGIYRLTYSIS